MVFYRKYRPQTIDELDNQNVRQALLSVFKKPEDSPHAFLFTGSKGLGKTSAARIVAKVVNCTGRKKGDIEPCNKCESCISITSGSNLDILEIDGASNRGIDEIRDLRDKIRLTPLSCLKKIYIIDEVHMLTTEAFNALLKTLEEPPSHVLFVLCTTESHKVPDTILSRCFHIQFSRATTDELIRSLARVIKGEKLDIEKDAISYIAYASDGSFRDGVKLLEEISLSADGKKITKELIEEKYKSSNISDIVKELILSFEKKDAKKGLELVAKVTEQGTDVKYVIEQLIDSLHANLLDIVQNNKESNLSALEIKKIIELLNKAHQEIKFSVLPQLPLELAIVEWCTQGTEVSQTQVSKISNVPKVSKGDPPSDTFDTSRSPSDTSSFWNRFIEETKKNNFSVAGVLRGCKLEKFEDGEMSISTKFKFHKERLDSSLTILEQTAKDLTGNPVKISIQLIN